MLVVEGRTIEAGRAWARVDGQLVRVDDLDDTGLLELESSWDHLVLIGPAGASEVRAATAFEALDELLATNGPTFFFGGVELAGRWRTAYLDAVADGGLDVADRRDGILRALRAGDVQALGPPLHVTSALFGEAATRPLGRALADAAEAGRFGAIRLAVASAELIPPERLAELLKLEGDDGDLDAPVALLGEQLAVLLGPLAATRRFRVLGGLWSSVQDMRDAAASDAKVRRFAEQIEAHVDDGGPSPWLRLAAQRHLESVERSGRFSPLLIVFSAIEAAAKELAASYGLLRLTLAERDGRFTEELHCLTFLIEALAAEDSIALTDRFSIAWPPAGPAVKRLVTLAVESAADSASMLKPAHIDTLLYPPMGRRCDRYRSH